jgi:predicted MFS family arabinose efflux permease
VAALVQTQLGPPKFLRIPVAALGLVLAHLGLALPLSAWGAGLCFAVAGYAMIATLISANTFIQLKVSSELRGRVIAVYSLALIGTGPLGAYLTGQVLEHFGARTTALALAILTSLGPLLALIHLPSKAQSPK